MTGRYARRSVPLTVRGIAAEKYIGHPLPETIKEHDSDDCTDEFSSTDILHQTDSRSESVAERNSTRASSIQTGMTQPVNDAPNIYHHFAGSATERSSIYSFGDDEFDRQSSLSVQKLFDELELILFERSAVGPVHLRNECNVWLSEFPHLRVVGTVKFPPQDLGYKFFEHNEEESDLTPRNAEDSNESQELIVKGSHIAVEKYSSDELPASGRTQDGSGFSVEELITQEGLVEEMLAIDIQPGENGNDYIRRDVLQDLFSEMWTDVVNGLEELLERQLQPHLYPFFGSRNTAPSISDLFHNMHEPSSVDSFLNRESTDISTIRPNAFDRALHGFSIGGKKLEEVLKISSKALQARDRNSIHDSSFYGDLTRPSSGYLPISGRHNNSRFNDNTASARSKVAGGRGRLVPITTGDQLKTFIIEDEAKHLDLAHEVIRGYKMTMPNDRFALLPTSSSISLSRPSDPLPPISSSSNNINSVFRKKGMLRVRSALANKALHVQEQTTERVWPSGDYTRPQRTINTLYTMDHPHFLGAGRRSSTTLGFNIIGVNQTRSTDSGAAGKNRRKLSITGNRIPEYEADVDDDCLSETAQLSTKLRFGRRSGQPHHQHINTAIR